MYKLGTQAELETLKEELENKIQPLVENQKDIEVILQAIQISLFVLDENYGANRNWQEDGGYTVIFSDITQDDSKELLLLLDQYHQNQSCMETERILVTAVTASGILDWVSEVYLIGTEYGITVIRPRLRGNFDDKTPRYLSRDAANYLPLIFHEFLYRSIEKMRNKVPLDYLQVFEFSLNKDNSILKLKHTQERPVCKQETFWVIPSIEGFFDDVEKWNGKKLYVIDDGMAIVTLFPYER